MDFMNRGTRPNSPVSNSPRTENTNDSPVSRNSAGRELFGLKLANVGLLFSTTVLILAVVFAVRFVSGAAPESKFVDSSKMQAVFLNSGQVYFGRIGSLNEQYLTVSDIYYLRVSQQVQPGQTQANNAQNDISLVKLGCELHGPTDEMVINRDQVTFWENLKGDGQVAKAVADYKKANPQGQKCDAPAEQTQTPTTTTPTTTPTTKKP